MPLIEVIEEIVLSNVTGDGMDSVTYHALAKVLEEGLALVRFIQACGHVGPQPVAPPPPATPTPSTA